jgi:DNA invertase Pin-like site-specific DNA recombinase
MKYIAYYRVSTEKQGLSGLGLEAQRIAVKRFIHPNQIEREFTEIESGRKKFRPILNEALELCRILDATIVIAKLDRLARNVSFVSALMESGVKFICCDMPQANELTINIISAIAQDEAKRISERTKAALSVKKQMGIKLGTPENLKYEHRLKGVATNKLKAKENLNNKRAIAYLEAISGTLQHKANQLNENGFKTSRGKVFTSTQVSRLIVVLQN